MRDEKEEEEEERREATRARCEADWFLLLWCPFGAWAPPYSVLLDGYHWHTGAIAMKTAHQQTNPQCLHFACAVASFTPDYKRHDKLQFDSFAELRLPGVLSGNRGPPLCA